MNTEKLREFIAAAWAHENNPSTIIDALQRYIAIPNASPGFDPDWTQNGHMDAAVDLFVQSVERLKAEWGTAAADISTTVLGGADAPEIDENGQRRSPLLVVDIPASGGEGCVLLYGHLDKQPGLDDRWSEGLGPYRPVLRDGKLYGRGGADDGYALFGALSAVMALRAQGAPHSRCVILIESCEESGSADLEHYVQKLRSSLGGVSLIVCLDSGCGDYQRLWLTNSLRGVVSGTLSVSVLREGVHSGDASGVAPSPFRIARQLLSRLENEATGEILPDFLKADIPPDIRRLTAATAAHLGDGVYNHFPFLDGVRPVDERQDELSLNRSWRSQLAVKGLDGVPPVAGSGNVLLPDIALGLSLRLPPTIDSVEAGAKLKALLEDKPPYRAKVSFTIEGCGNGWNAPGDAGWLNRAVDEASETYFGAPAMASGEGGSIPFMGMLAEVFPGAAFLVTGVLGPGSSAHGPDEFLHLQTAERVAMSVAHVIAAQAANGA